MKNIFGLISLPYIILWDRAIGRRHNVSFTGGGLGDAMLGFLAVVSAILQVALALVVTLIYALFF